jgi:small subunit ribosomal protein S8
VIVASSKTKLSIVKILKDEGFVDHYEVLKGKPQPVIKIHLKYTDEQPAILGLERVSKPGLRVYVEGHEIPRVYGGLGVAIMSTSKGVMTGQEAWRQRIGGEILCYVW